LASGSLRLMELAVDSKQLDTRLQQELERIAPAEILRADGQIMASPERSIVQSVPDWHFDISAVQTALQEQLGVASLAGFAAEALSAACGACPAALCPINPGQGFTTCARLAGGNRTSLLQ
jgi:DNA mismatch repair protein MutS